MQTSNREDSNLRSFFDYLFIEKGLSKNTIKAYEVDIERFIQWLKQNNKSDYLNAKEIQINKYISHLFKTHLKSSSINRKISSIKAFYLFLMKKNILKVSPIAEIVTPKQEKYLPTSMSEPEIEKLLKSPNTKLKIEKRDRAMIEMLYATGMRISELVNLKITNLDIQRCVVKVLGKGSKERLIPFGEVASEALNDYMKENLFDKIGMNNTTFHLDENEFENLAYVYDYFDNNLMLNKDITFFQEEKISDEGKVLV